MLENTPQPLHLPVIFSAFRDRLDDEWHRLFLPANFATAWLRVRSIIERPTRSIIRLSCDHQLPASTGYDLMTRAEGQNSGFATLAVRVTERFLDGYRW